MMKRKIIIIITTAITNFFTIIMLINLKFEAIFLQMMTLRLVFKNILAIVFTFKAKSFIFEFKKFIIIVI